MYLLFQEKLQKYFFLKKIYVDTILKSEFTEPLEYLYEYIVPVALELL